MVRIVGREVDQTCPRRPLVRWWPRAAPSGLIRQVGSCDGTRPGRNVHGGWRMRTSIRSSVRKRVRRTVIGAMVMLPLAAGAMVVSAPGASAAGTTIASLLGAAGPGNGVGGFAVF